MAQALWIGAMVLVGGLLGLRRGWRRQMLEAAACVVSLAVAWWQYPRVVSHVRAIWPAMDGAAWGPAAVRQATLVYLFAALYGLAHALLSLYAPDCPGSRPGHWLAGLIGAAQVGVLALLSIALLPRV